MTSYRRPQLNNDAFEIVTTSPPSAMGIPTLDGMGAVGEGAHAQHESVVVEHLAIRTALIAGMVVERRCD